jgi:putative ABC transport system permease protein
MLTNYLKTALRGFLRQKSYTLINIAGLSVGLACSFLILLWVVDELSVNQFHDDGRLISQVMRNHRSSTRIHTWGSLPKPTADVIDAEIPEITNTVLFSWTRYHVFHKPDGETFRRRGFFTSDDFFQVFTFPLLYGTPETALNAPDAIAISSDLAEEIFGSDWEDKGVIGQSVSIGKWRDFTVRAVFAYPPRQSSFRFHYLLNVAVDLEERPSLEKWGNSSLRLFVRRQAGTDPDKVEAAIRNIVADHQDQKRSVLWLHPLEDLYLYSQYQNGVVTGGRIDYVRIFAVVSLLILLIAGINYTNLATARSATRAQEIGVRKAVGANRATLIGQFMGESFLLTLGAGVVAIGLILIAIPYFNDVVRKELSFSLLDIPALSAFVGVCLLGGLCGGAYPALYLAGFHPIHALRGSHKHKPGAGRFRQALVVFQFSWSIVLIVGTMTVYNQLSYIQTRNIGLERENLLHLDMQGETKKKYQAIKTELLKHPEFLSVSRSNQNPLNVGNSTWGPKWEGKDPETQYTINIIKAGFDYEETLGLNIVAGRPFSADRDVEDKENMSFLINEEMARTMGFPDPIGQVIKFWGNTGKVVGVVQDFHINSMRRAIGPLIIRLDTQDAWRLDARIAAGKEERAVEVLKEVHALFSPDFPMNYRFVSEDFNRMYRKESVLVTLATTFAALAGFISCLGLYGLASFAAAQRTKEIGIRKILGAPMLHLIGVLSKDFLSVVIIAFLISVPAAYYYLSDWLSGFESRIELSWTVFAFGGLLALSIAWLTISTQAIRVARTDPVDTLRAE